MVATAVLFDMNGVLIDDEPLHKEAFATALSRHGMPLDEAEYDEHFAGRTDRDGLRGFLTARGRAFTESDISRLVHDKFTAYADLAAHHLRAYPGAASLVRDLDQTGHTLALVTSSTRAEVDIVLQHLGIRDSFTHITTAEDVQEGKPSPEPYLSTAAALGVPPAQCVVVEDSPAGVASAVAAGARCIAVTTTHSHEELAAADLVLPDLLALSTAHFDQLATRRE